MNNDLMRFSVSMPEDLLVRFDRLVAKRGLLKNRSEVIRDLVREAIIAEDSATPGVEVMGTLSIAYNHHTSDLHEKLDKIQHDYYDVIVSSQHIHMDSDNCFEVILLRGETTVVQEVANLILGTKGVRTGKLVLTTTGKSL